MSTPPPDFPFAAVVGQSNYKLALTLVSIDPGIGGLLVSGPRGTAKSTLARGLAQLSGPECRFVNLPLGASEDMLVGTLDLQGVMDRQQVEFHPGLLAKADGGILYVDEVNLLPDPLVDLLLDVSASGINRVERDGISREHEARFILLGTMNPDEGELRPQLLDRFGLMVEIDARFSAEDRVAIVEAREAFERDPVAFIEQYDQAQQSLRERIQTATSELSGVCCDGEIRLEIANRCIAAGVDGLRADIVWQRAALAHAAWEGRDKVLPKDLDAVEALVISHRCNPDNSRDQTPGSGEGSDRSEPAGNNDSSSAGDWGQMAPVAQKTAPGSVFAAPEMSAQLSGSSQFEGFAAGLGDVSRGSGRKRRTGRRLDWFRTLIANHGRWPLERLLRKSESRGQPRLHLVLLDTSASTLKNNRFADAKAVILEIADRAYLAREQLAIVGFGNQQVQTLLPRKRAPRALRKLLDGIDAGGGTPLLDVLRQASRYREKLLRQQPGLRIDNYLITDGKSSVALEQLSPIGQTLLIDTEDSRVKRGRGVAIAAALDAVYYPLPTSPLMAS